MITISPCPNCGNVRTKTFVDAPWKAHCYCNKCWFSGPECVGRNSREAAVHAWNRLALAVQIAEAAWLEREAEHAGYTTVIHGQRARQLESCARLEKHRLLDAWGKDGSQEGQPRTSVRSAVCGAGTTGVNATVGAR